MPANARERRWGEAPASRNPETFIVQRAAGSIAPARPKAYPFPNSVLVSLDALEQIFLIMKKIALFSSLLLAAVIARADVVIEQKVESPFLTGPMTIKIKGDLMKIDSPMPGGAGNVTSIVDLNKNQATTLMHAQKMAMTMDLSTVKKQAADLSNKTEKPKPTGAKEKVGDWNTEVYEVNVGGMAMKLWSTKDFPNTAAIKDQMSKLAKGAVAGMDPSQFEVPGIVVKTEMGTAQGKITSTVVSVKEAPVADSEFAIPADYQKMAMPSLPGGAGGLPGQ